MQSPVRFTDTLPVIIRRYDFILLFLLLFLVYNTVSGFGTISGDVAPASLLPVALLTTHTPYLDYATPFISSPHYSYAFPLVQGHYVSLFPIVTPVLATPVYAISYVLCNLFGVTFTFNEFFLLAKTAAAVIAALAGVLVYLSGKELFSKRIALLTTIIFAFATSTWSISSQALWQQGTVELLLSALLYLIIRNEKKESLVYLLLMGILSGLFVFNRPPDSLLLIPVIFYMVWYQRTKIHYYLIGGILGGLPFLYYNYSIFGSVFGGYADNLSLFAVNGGFVGHLLGLLLSPNGGLFIFCPVLLLSLAGFYLIYSNRDSHIRTLLLVSGLAVLLEILMYSFWNTLSASAAFCFGPRYLTGLIPILCLFTGYFLEDWFGTGKAGHQGTKQWIAVAVVGGLIVVSICIQFIGAFYYLWSSDANKTMNDDRAWNITDSVIIGSYTTGSPKITGVSIYTLPPLPPLFDYNFRSSGT
ncbi:glycosyltransferase family 39 protein [uncultured Methanoregula sp.]|uniref:glycosyltransferase family 39 protein n=1 Tax=uncultured Methanoregula sp. TaxID=1005933 RepID=UPI002AAA71DB|nr:glycosyltransferase family 39 protein [uncultured Methanoregula sp.]